MAILLSALSLQMKVSKPLSPSQTIATCQRNISQHCWTQHVCVWPPCCDVLRHLTIFKLEPTTPNMSQHIATRWPNARNMLRPTMLRCVALGYCDRLFGALPNFRFGKQHPPHFGTTLNDAFLMSRIMINGRNE